MQEALRLETPRLKLRRFTPFDLAELIALDSDPEVMRFINGGAPVSAEAMARDVLPLFMRLDPRLPWCGFWVLEKKDGADFVGWCSLRSSEKSSEVILGYRLHRRFWGYGYATEATETLIMKAFTEMPVQRISATTYEHNEASRRVMEKLGMTMARRFRMSFEELAQSDTHVAESDTLWDGDDVVYVLTKEDWLKRGT